MGRYTINDMRYVILEVIKIIGPNEYRISNTECRMMKLGITYLFELRSAVETLLTKMEINSLLSLIAINNLLSELSSSAL